MATAKAAALGYTADDREGNDQHERAKLQAAPEGSRVQRQRSQRQQRGPGDSERPHRQPDRREGAKDCLLSGRAAFPQLRRRLCCHGRSLGAQVWPLAWPGRRLSSEAADWLGVSSVPCS